MKLKFFFIAFHLIKKKFKFTKELLNLFFVVKKKTAALSPCLFKRYICLRSNVQFVFFEFLQNMNSKCYLLFDMISKHGFGSTCIWLFILNSVLFVLNLGAALVLQMLSFSKQKHIIPRFEEERRCKVIEIKKNNLQTLPEYFTPNIQTLTL